MKNLRVVMLMIVGLLIFQSCVEKEEKNNVLDTAPTLPETEAFIMPFDGYETADTSGYVGQDENTADTRSTFFNWFHGATNVVVWNTVVTLNLVIPTAAFLESFNHDPVAQGNGVWLWEYDFTGPNNILHTAKLYGEVLDAEEVEWKMYISRENGFQDIEWYTGITSATQAVWNLNHRSNAGSVEPLLKIEHERANANGEASIKYTNIVPNNPNNGDYIEYREDESSALFNRAYDIFRISTGNLIEIQWNNPDNDGRVKDEARFNDAEWHCWDTNKMDIDC